MYLKVHDEAYAVRQMTHRLVGELRDKFNLALCFESSADGRCDPASVLHSPELTLLQKKALFNVFMTHVWKPAEPEEGEDEDEDGDDDDEDEDDDDEYDEDDDDDDEDEDEDDDSDASGSDGDDDEEEEDASASSGSDSD